MSIYRGDLVKLSFETELNSGNRKEVAASKYYYPIDVCDKDDDRWSDWAGLGECHKVAFDAEFVAVMKSKKWARRRANRNYRMMSKRLRGSAG